MALQAAAGALEDLRRSTSPEDDAAEPDPEPAVPRLITYKRGKRNSNASKQSSTAAAASASSPPMTEADRALGAAEALVKAGSKRKSGKAAQTDSADNAQAPVEVSHSMAGTSKAEADKMEQQPTRAWQSARKKGKEVDSLAEEAPVISKQQQAGKGKGKRATRSQAAEDETAGSSQNEPPLSQRGGSSATASTSSGAVAEHAVPAETDAPDGTEAEEAQSQQGKAQQGKARGRSRLSKASSAVDPPPAVAQQKGASQLPGSSRRGTKRSQPDTAAAAGHDAAATHPVEETKATPAADDASFQQGQSGPSAKKRGGANATAAQGTTKRKRASRNGAVSGSDEHETATTAVEPVDGEHPPAGSKRKSNAKALPKTAATAQAGQTPATAIKSGRKHRGSAAPSKNEPESTQAQHESQGGRAKRSRQSTPSMDADVAGSVAEHVKAGRENRYSVHLSQGTLAACIRAGYHSDNTHIPQSLVSD